MGRAILARERRQLQLGHRSEQVGEGHLRLAKLHQHPTGERARGRPRDPGSALEVRDDAPRQVGVAVQPPHGDARARERPVSFGQRRQGCRFVRGGPGQFRRERSRRRQERPRIGRRRVEADQDIAGQRVGLGTPHPRNPAQPRLQFATSAEQQAQVAVLATHVETFRATIAHGLDQASFARRRELVEVLIDRVLVAPPEVAIRYLIPFGGAAHR